MGGGGTKIVYVLEVDMGIKNIGPCVIFVWNKLEYMDIHIHLHLAKRTSVSYKFEQLLYESRYFCVAILAFFLQ